MGFPFAYLNILVWILVFPILKISFQVVSVRAGRFSKYSRSLLERRIEVNSQEHLERIQPFEVVRDQIIFDIGLGRCDVLVVLCIKGLGSYVHSATQ